MTKVTQSTCLANLTIRPWASDDLIRSFSFGHPFVEHLYLIEGVGSRASLAVIDTGHHEQDDGVRVIFTDGFEDSVVISLRQSPPRKGFGTFFHPPGFQSVKGNGQKKAQNSQNFHHFG